MYLWVVSCGQAMLDFETLHEFLIELVAKLLPLVRGQDLWQAHAHEDLKRNYFSQYECIAVFKHKHYFEINYSN